MINAQPKPTRILDEPYLDYIRGLKCVGLYLFHDGDREGHAKNCTFIQSGRSEANHMRKAYFTGLGTKPSDKGFTLPFCSILHHFYTSLGHRTFLATYRLSERTLFGTMKLLEREYDRLNPKVREKRPRVKTDRLLLQHGICGETHRVKSGFFYCSRLKKQIGI